MLHKAKSTNVSAGMILWLASSLSAVAILPYVTALAPGVLAGAAQEMQISVSTVIVISLVQSCILLGIATFTGLWAAKRLSLGAPLIDAVLNKRPLPYDLKKTSSHVIAVSLATGAVIYVLEMNVFSSVSAQLAIQSSEIELWKGILASFYGGIAEEIQLRLFLLSGIALAIRYVANTMSSERKGAGDLTNGVFWTANVLTAVLFGLLHLPVTAELMPLTPLFVTRIILLNGIVGLIAGLFFRNRGIEMAILFHFILDLFLHVLVPVLT